MKSKRDIKGFWWMPDRPDTRWFGTLTLEPGETPKLDLFVERCGWSDPSLPVGQVMHGQDEHGKPITLLFVSSGGETVSAAALKRTCHAGYALVGIAAPDASSFVAHSLEFQMQHLYGWVDRSGYHEDSGNSTAAVSIHYTHPEDQWFAITPDLELGIHSLFGFKDRGREKVLQEEAALTFRSKAGFSLARCRELVGAVRLLLHFASLEKVYPVTVVANTSGHGYRFEDRWINHDIHVYSAILREPCADLRRPDGWIFRFNDVQEDFGGFVRNWLDYTEKHGEAIGCYSSTIYHKLTWELELLTLTQAMDAYHGVKFLSHDKQDFRAKIEDLCNYHSPCLDGLIDDIPDFTSRVTCTRNYYTHHNPKWPKTGKVARGADLLRMNERLRLLFQMCVLSDIGIPADRFVHLRRQLATDIMLYE